VCIIHRERYKGEHEILRLASDVGTDTSATVAIPIFVPKGLMQLNIGIRRENGTIRRVVYFEVVRFRKWVSQWRTERSIESSRGPTFIDPAIYREAAACGPTSKLDLCNCLG
jgi:hypothetical protein